MANRHHGEIPVEIGEGPDKRTLIWRLGNNELIGLQDALGMNDDDERFLLTIDKPGSFRRLRAIAFWALKYGQPEITEDQAGDIVTELGIPRIRKLIDQALEWAMPDKSDTPSGATKGKDVAASPGPLPS